MSDEASHDSGGVSLGDSSRHGGNGTGVRVRQGAGSGRRPDRHQAKDGEFALIAVVPRGLSTATFSGLLGAGERYEQGTGGGVLIVNDKDEITAVVAAPWARDAKGRDLPTEYTVKGDDLVQTIDVTGAAFPIVADPTVTAGTYGGVIPVFRIQFTWTETTVAYRNIGTGRKVGDILCGFVPTVVAKAACGFWLNVVGQDLENNLRAAVSERRCLKVRVPAILSSPYLYVYDGYRVTCTS